MQPFSKPAASGGVRELGRALGLSAVSRAGAMVGSLAINALLARTLTVSEYAYVGVLIALSAVAMVFLQFGYQTAIVKTAGEASHSGDMTQLSNNLGAGTLVTVLLGLVTLVPLMVRRAAILPDVNGAPPSDTVVLLTMAFTTTLALNVFYAEAIRGLGRVGTASSLTGMGQHGGIARASFILAMAAPLAFFHVLNLETTLALSSLASIAVCGWSLGILRRVAPVLASPAATWRAFARDVQLNVQMMLGQILQLFASQHATLVIGGILLSGKPLALLVAAQQLRNILTAPMTLFNGASPKLLIHAFQNGDYEELQKLMRLGTSMALVFVLGASAVLLAGGSQLFTFLFGAKYGEAAPYFAVLVPGLVAFAMGGTAGRALILLGHQRLFMYYSIFIAAVTVPSSVWATQTYGAMGLASMTSAVLIVQNVILVLIARKVIGVWSHAYLSPGQYLALFAQVRRRLRRRGAR